MTDSPSTTRIEITETETKIVFTDYQSLHRDLRDEGLFERLGKRMDNISDEERALLTSLYTTMDYRKNTIRVSSAKRFSNTEPAILPTAENLAFCEAQITERDPTQAEKAPYEDAFMDCPSPVYEFSLPPLQDFYTPLESDSFTTALHNPDELETVSEKLQRKIETAKWLKIKTSYTGAKTNLDPEWNPKVDSVNADKTKGGAKQKYFTAREIWKDLLGVNYQEWFAARLFILERTERKLDGREIVALELFEDSEEESHCQYCGCIDDANNLLKLPDKLDREKRVCETCADVWSDFSDDVVAKAKDDKAKEHGGQRVFHEDYE